MTEDAPGDRLRCTDEEGRRYRDGVYVPLDEPERAGETSDAGHSVPGADADAVMEPASADSPGGDEAEKDADGSRGA